MTMSTFFITSTTTFPKIDYYSNTFYKNLQSANIYTLMLFIFSKSTFGKKISFDKANKSIFYIMLKAVFTKKVYNDNDNCNIITHS